MTDIKITLETLYDILRNEKKKEDLQKLEGTFFLDVVQYMKEKQFLLESKEKSDELFAAGEKDKLEYELRSIKRILKDIYEKREKKILDIALNKSKTGSDIIDTSAMLHEEREFYQKTLKIFDDFRKGVLLRVHQAEMPQLPDQKELVVEEKKKEQSQEDKTLQAPEPAKVFIEEKKEIVKETELEPKPELTTNKDNTPTPFDKFSPTPKVSPAMTKIKFTCPTPSFIWKDMKEYGPFDPGEELEIYPEVADLIIRKGRAVKVS